ncbi:MAG: glycosyltransferase family 2 protein [Acidilobus sp.]
MSWTGLAKLARRTLGRVGTWAAYNALAAIATGLHLVDARGEGRGPGVSAMVITYNDPDWLWTSLRGAAEVADEVIVVDSSDDPEALGVLERAREELGVIVYRQYPPRGYAEAREEGLRRTTRRFVLVWDSDFVPYPELTELVRGFAESHAGRSYYLVYWPYLNLCGDTWHRCRADRFHVEHWMFTYSRRLRYMWDGRNEYLYAPPYYFRSWLSRKPLGVHLSGVRRPDRKAFKALAARAGFHEIARTRGYQEALMAVREEARRLYGTDDLWEVGVRMIRDEVRSRPCASGFLVPDEVRERARQLGIPETPCY